MEKAKVVKSDKTIAFWGIGWAIVYCAVLLLLKKFEVPTAVGMAISFVPGVMFAMFMISFVRGFRKGDEFEKLIFMEAVSFAFALSIILIMTLGLIEIIVPLPKEDFSFRHMLPFFVIFFLGGLILARKKYS